MPGFLDIVTNERSDAGVVTEKRVHLNSPFAALKIKEWNPLAPPPEDLFQSSPFEDGRMLVMRKYGNVADDFTVGIEGECTPIVDKEYERVRAILKKSVDYWIIDWTNEPVWLEMQGDGETHVRYAYIYAWDAPGENNPFQPPRIDSPALIDDAHLIIEHGMWLDALSPSCVQLSATQAYFDQNDGNWCSQASFDDVYVDRTALTLFQASHLVMGKTAVPHTDGAGIRFIGVGIPSGVTIISAFIDFMAQSNQVGVTCNLIIKGENSSAPAIFTNFANYTGRALLGTTVAWNAVPAWTINLHYQTPDISPIIQAIIGIGGWASGHNLVLFVEDNGSSNGAQRVATDSDDFTPPTLYVTWYDTTTRTYGQTASCNPVYVADRHNQAQITNAYWNDVSAGTWSTNKIGAALPTSLFPPAHAVGDFLYLMCNTALPNSGPFGSAVFDLSIVDAGMTGVWEYYNGAWLAIPIFGDFTTGFTVLGVNEVNYEQPID